MVDLDNLRLSYHYDYYFNCIDCKNKKLCDKNYKQDRIKYYLKMTKLHEQIESLMLNRCDKPGKNYTFKYLTKGNPQLEEFEELTRICNIRIYTPKKNETKPTCVPVHVGGNILIYPDTGEVIYPETIWTFFKKWCKNLFKREEKNENTNRNG